MAEETLEAETATLNRPPPSPASPRDDKPFAGVPPREAAMPAVSVQDQSEIHRKRRLLLAGGVLLCVLATALYLALSRRTPGSQPHPGSNPPASSLTNSLGMQFT